MDNLAAFFEVAMLVCFAAAWPSSIYKSWKSRTRKGKSLLFLLIVETGYIAGILGVVMRSGSSLKMVIPYTFNALLVFCDIVLYYRNYRIDEGLTVPERTDKIRERKGE
ncbi:MAG: hypothetical protein Q4E17_04165 [Synergistes sp.]|nr:hypothetical protein [Synergistes sp.]